MNGLHPIHFAQYCRERLNVNWGVTVPPATEPVTLDEVKRQTRKEDDLEDEYLETLITVARSNIETYLDRALITQTIKVTGRNWLSRLTPCLLPGSPVQEITSFQYRTSDDGDLIALDTADYELDVLAVPSLLRAKNSNWPAMEYFEIEFTAGYGDDADAVPMPIRHAIKMLAGTLYFNRESLADSSQVEASAYGALLAPYRVYR